MTAMSMSTARTPHLRLTSRGRMVFGILAAIPMIAIAILVGPNVLGAQATSEPGTGDFTYVSIAPGESLWQLAAEVAPQADPREVVADILKLNNLSSGDVQPGQELALPPQYASLP
jgi:ABC-type Co2+ transport system permease subunit